MSMIIQLLKGWVANKVEQQSVKDFLWSFLSPGPGSYYTATLLKAPLLLFVYIPTNHHSNFFQSPLLIIWLPATSLVIVSQYSFWSGHYDHHQIHIINFFFQSWAYFFSVIPGKFFS